MMRFCDAGCKDQGGAHAPAVAVKLNLPDFAFVGEQGIGDQAIAIGMLIPVADFVKGLRYRMSR
jgi:hypothetical protein